MILISQEEMAMTRPSSFTAGWIMFIKGNKTRFGLHSWCLVLSLLVTMLPPTSVHPTLFSFVLPFSLEPAEENQRWEGMARKMTTVKWRDHRCLTTRHQLDCSEAGELQATNRKRVIHYTASFIWEQRETSLNLPQNEFFFMVLVCFTHR